MKGYGSLIEHARKLEYKKCAEDFLYFIKHYCVIEDKDAEGSTVIPFVPWDSQTELVESVHAHKLNIILKARQLGITWLMLYYCIWDCAFHGGHTTIALSKREDDAVELVRRVGVVCGRCASLFSGDGVRIESNMSEVKFIFPNDLVSTFKSFPATESAGRSFTGNILLLDEWAFQQYAEKIFTSAFPTINRPNGGKVIGLSTIKRGTYFEKVWNGDNNFNKLFLGVFADPRRTREWYDETERALGRKVLQEYPRTAEEALSTMEGLFFDEFDPNIHTCKPFAIQDSWRIYGTMDYGIDMLAHYKIAVSPDGICYVFDEIYESNKVVSEAARLILSADRKRDEFGDIKIKDVPYLRLAPPDLYAVSAETGRSQAEAFRECGVTLVKTSNERETGWLAVKELLRSGKLIIFTRCKNLIRTMQSLIVKEDNPRDCEKEPHEYTHAPDALRYFAIYWYKPNKTEATEKKVKYSKDMLEDYNKSSPEIRRKIIERMGGLPE